MVSAIYSSFVFGQQNPSGASFFQYLTNQSGLSYDGSPLPEDQDPFINLVQRLNQYTNFFAAVIPYGRSLQKMTSYPHALKHPRIVLASDTDKSNLNEHLHGRLFIAYVKPSKKLEIISYNPIKARFEFQIVDNFYPGGKAKLFNADRQLCLRCHQGEAPIFAGGDWLESTSLNQSLQNKVLQEIKTPEYLGIPINREKKSSQFDLLTRPERVDDMTHIGALLIGYQKAWHGICKKSANFRECYEELFLWMLLSNIDQELAWLPRKHIFESFLKELKMGEVAIPKDRIPDHNPLVNGQLSYELPVEKDPSLPRKNLRVTLPNHKESRGIQYSRFHTLIRKIGQSLFTQNDLLKIKQYLGKPHRMIHLSLSASTIDNIEDKVRHDFCFPTSLHIQKVLDQSLTQAPTLKCYTKTAQSLIHGINRMQIIELQSFSRERMLNDLSRVLQVPLIKSKCCQKNLPSLTRERKVSNFLKSESIKDDRLKPFFDYCSECHLYQDLPVPFLAGKREEEIIKNILKRKELIKMRVLNGQMPPHYAQKKLSHKENKDLLYQLSQLN